jgi:thioredoxin reductase (NADPH)
MNNDIKKLVIVGSGPAGLTAAIYAARANLAPIVIQGNAPGGQLMGTSFIENWPGEKSILGPTLMMNMQAQAQQLGATLISEQVVKVDFSRKPFSLVTDQNNEFKAHAVIIATGATHKKLGCTGESTYWGKGVTTCAVCDGAFYPNKRLMVVGGGDTAMEDASFLTKFTDKITIVHILDKLTASHAMQQRVIDNPHISIIYNSTVTEIKGNGEHVTSAVITHQKTGATSEQAVDAIFVAVGLKPNTDPFKGQIAMNEWGHILLENNTHSSVPGVFVAGDVFDVRYRQAITAAGSGCMAALDAERYLSSLPGVE